MFKSHLKHPVDAIVPGQLAMLQRVFDHACTASGIQKNTARAEGLAATLIELYNSGTHDEEQLEDMLSNITII
jgi:hypothetical protein